MAGLRPPERDIGVLRAPVRSSIILGGLFLIVVLGLGLFERLGAGGGFAAAAVIAAALALFALVGLFAHARRAADYYVADRSVSGSLGGLSGGAGLVGLIVVGLAGGALGTPAEIAGASIGLILGLLLHSVLVAPGLRRSGAYTAGDFLAVRLGSAWAQAGAAVVVLASSFLLFLVYLKFSAPLLATMFGLDADHALYAAALSMALAVLPGGMRSLTWASAVQYVTILFACLLPAGFLTLRGEAALGPGLDLGALLASVATPAEGASSQFALATVAAGFGVASLGQVTGRALAARSARESGTTMLWMLAFTAAAVASGLLTVELLSGTIGAETAAAARGDLIQLAALFGALPAVLAGLLLAGLLAALLAGGQAALFAAATAISHDIWDEIVDRTGTEGRRIVVARLAIAGLAGGGVIVARWETADAAALFGWALALAAAGLLAPLLAGLWWRRCNEVGAIAGMAAGFGFTSVILALSLLDPGRDDAIGDWAALSAPAAGIVGVLIAFVVSVAASLATPAAEIDLDVESRPDTGRDAPPIRERPA